MTLSSPKSGQIAQSVRAAKNDTSKDFAASSQGLPPRNASNRQKTEPHARLTVADVKQGWLDGYFSAPGYLALLFKSMKAEGLPIYIRNVAQFCQEWEIGERRFYRAKAKLIEQGCLEEEIQGNLIVRIISKKQDRLYDDITVSDSDITVSQIDTGVSGSDITVSQIDTGVSDTPSKSFQDSAFEDSPDLYSDLDQISNNSLSQPTHPPEREFNNFSQENEEEEFREWLTKKAYQMPYKPTLIHQWVTKQMEKPENRTEFLKYREALIERTNFPPVPVDFPATLVDYIYPLAHLSETEQRRNHLARLQAKWKQPALQSAAIAEAEKHGFLVTATGIEEA